MVVFYRFTERFELMPGGEIWNCLKRELAENIIIESIKKRVLYTIHRVDEERIVFSVATRNDGMPDVIERSIFLLLVDDLKRMVMFNTSQSKEVFAKVGIYKKRSPCFAILLFARIIEPLKMSYL